MRSASLPGGSSQALVFSTPGTYTWIAPAGVSLVRVTLVAGGGGGGPGGATNGGGGGGGGGTILGYPVPVTAGQSYTVTVGSGGTGGAVGAAGGNGGPSLFYGGLIVNGQLAVSGGVGATAAGAGGGGGAAPSPAPNQGYPLYGTAGNTVPGGAAGAGGGGGLVLTIGDIGFVTGSGGGGGSTTAASNPEGAGAVAAYFPNPSYAIYQTFGYQMAGLDGPAPAGAYAGSVGGSSFFGIGGANNNGTPAIGVNGNGYGAGGAGGAGGATAYGGGNGAGGLAIIEAVG